MYNIGASEGPMFAQAVKEMTEKARELGPSPITRKKHNEGDQGEGR